MATTQVTAIKDTKQVSSQEFHQRQGLPLRQKANFSEARHSLRNECPSCVPTATLELFDVYLKFADVSNTGYLRPASEDVITPFKASV